MPTATPGFAVPQGFFNLAPKRWWRFKDLTTNAISTVECSAEGNDGYLLKHTLGSTVTEHHVQFRQVDVNGVPAEEYNLVASKYPAGYFTWIGGLKIPGVWRVGDSVIARSKESNSATNHPMELTLKLLRQENIVPPTGGTYPPGQSFHCIEIEHLLKDVQGTGFAKGKKLFVFSAGMASADGAMCGVSTTLRFQSMGDGPMPTT